MKLIIISVLFFIFSIAIVQSKNPVQNFSKQKFYEIMADGKLDRVNEELDLVTASDISDKEGYEAALLIRKAGLLKLPGERLKLFKKGRIKLETALMNDKNNGEYHFLRLSIEEHAPKIVKYHSDLETDKEYVKKSFKSLSPVVQQAIIDYCKNSKVLQAQDF